VSADRRETKLWQVQNHDAAHGCAGKLCITMIIIGWPPISDLELCPYPFQGIRFRLPVCPFSFFRAICPFSRGKTLFPIIFRKMLHFGKIPKIFGKIWLKFGQNSGNIREICKLCNIV
jgi:hypothetical protein